VGEAWEHDGHWYSLWRNRGGRAPTLLGQAHPSCVEPGRWYAQTAGGFWCAYFPTRREAMRALFLRVMESGTDPNRGLSP
jgi:hypothetical protein